MVLSLGRYEGLDFQLLCIVTEQVLYRGLIKLLRVIGIAQCLTAFTASPHFGNVPSHLAIYAFANCDGGAGGVSHVPGLWRTIWSLHIHRDANAISKPQRDLSPAAKAVFGLPKHVWVGSKN